MEEKINYRKFKCFDCDEVRFEYCFDTYIDKDGNKTRCRVCAGCKLDKKGRSFNLKQERELRNNLREDTRLRDRDNTFPKYKISKEDYMRMFLGQEGRCKICLTHEDSLNKRLAIDHCHETGEVRGLLCMRCNSALGLLKENINIVDNALTYLKEAKFKRDTIEKNLKEKEKGGSKFLSGIQL